MMKRDIAREVIRAARDYPVVAAMGPRQSGKTTLVKSVFPKLPYFSLEDPDTRSAAEADPRGFLENSDKGMVLDEIQNMPVLLSYIQGIVDKSRKRGRFILTGSHQPKLHDAIAQSLAGRTAILTLWPFSFSELRNYKKDLKPFDLIFRGCFPRVRQENLEPRRFFNNYLQTYVERDVRALVQVRDLATFQKFLRLLAGRVGQVVNFASLSNDLGVSSTTLENWLSVLEASYVAFELPPYFENVGKRVIKSPKIYFTDAGLAAFLLGIHSADQAERDPARGFLYENLVISEIMKCGFNKGIRPEVYFYRDSNGNEVDLVIREKGTLYPVEIKSSETFSTDFLKGIERFKPSKSARVAPGAVLYNGGQNLKIKGVRIFNPMPENNLWESIVS